jgi:hypothetical protein
MLHYILHKCEATCFSQLYGHLHANFMLSELPEDDYIAPSGQHM